MISPDSAPRIRLLKRIEPQPGLLLFGAVTNHAMPLEHRRHASGEKRRSRRAAPRRERRTQTANATVGQVFDLPIAHVGSRGQVNDPPLLRSSQDAIDDLGRHDAGELLIEALELERELVVIEAEQVEDRRVQVADVHRVLHDVVGEIVGLAVRRMPAFTPPPAIHMLKQRG